MVEWGSVILITSNNQLWELREKVVLLTHPTPRSVTASPLVLPDASPCLCRVHVCISTCGKLLHAMAVAVQDMETKLDILFQKQLFPLVSECPLGCLLGLGVYRLVYN